MMESTTDKAVCKNCKTDNIFCHEEIAVHIDACSLPVADYGPGVGKG